MRQAAFIYALSHIGPRLARVRARTWILLGAGALALLGLLAWAAIALMSWLWGQASGLAESGKQATGVVMERAGEVAPELKARLDPLLRGAGLPVPSDAPATAADVSGSDLAGLERYPGMTRVYFAREASQTELRYAGSGELPTVLKHYVAQFSAAGYLGEILSASPDAERHRFSKPGEVVDFEIRKTGPEGNIEISLINKIS